MVYARCVIVQIRKSALTACRVVSCTSTARSGIPTGVHPTALGPLRPVPGSFPGPVPRPPWFLSLPGSTLLSLASGSPSWCPFLAGEGVFFRGRFAVSVKRPSISRSSALSRVQSRRPFAAGVRVQAVKSRVPLFRVCWLWPGIIGLTWASVTQHMAPRPLGVLRLVLRFCLVLGFSSARERPALVAVFLCLPIKAPSGSERVRPALAHIACACGSTASCACALMGAVLFVGRRPGPALYLASAARSGPLRPSRQAVF